MKLSKRNMAVRFVAATAMSLGLSAGVVGIASASAHGNAAHHDSSWSVNNAVEGVVTGYVAGTSISIEGHGATTSTTYALSSSTTVSGLASGASLLNSKVVITLSSTTPVTVLSIKVLPLRAPLVEGVVTGYVAGTSISIEGHGATASTTYALSSSTTVSGLASGASLLNSKVVITLSSTTPVTVLSIKVLTGNSTCDHGHGDAWMSTGGLKVHGSFNFTNGRGNDSRHENFQR